MTDGSFDLDINNYELEDILKLFKLQYSFKDADLKGAYRIVLMTHPDKSGLLADYFRFYMKAYKILEKIVFFRKQRTKCRHDTIYNPNENENSSDHAAANNSLLHFLDGKSVKDFNKWFNKMFEKVKIHDEETDGGYDEWIDNNQTSTNNQKISLNEFGRVFEKTKSECKALVKHTGIKEMGDCDGGGYNLERRDVGNYSSAIFSKMPYEDFKKAHTETVVPVTNADFLEKKQFANVDMYKQHRQQQNTTPLSLQQSKQYLAEKSQCELEVDSRRAFKIIKKDEEVERCNDQWWSNLRRLTL